VQEADKEVLILPIIHPLYEVRFAQKLNEIAFKIHQSKILVV